VEKVMRKKWIRKVKKKKDVEKG